MAVKGMGATVTVMDAAGFAPASPLQGALLVLSYAPELIPHTILS